MGHNVLYFEGKMALTSGLIIFIAKPRLYIQIWIVVLFKSVFIFIKQLKLQYEKNNSHI